MEEDYEKAEMVGLRRNYFHDFFFCPIRRFLGSFSPRLEAQPVMSYHFVD
jgi:hypothetical protein